MIPAEPLRSLCYIPQPIKPAVPSRMTEFEHRPMHDRIYPVRWVSLGLMLVAAAYLVPGLVGHDPWKQDEAYSFGIIYNMYLTGDLVVPTLAADPFMEKPPAYYITAVGLLHLLDGWLPLHDAARLATAIYLAIAFLFTGLLARATWAEGFAAPALILLMSSLGLVQHGHYMITDTALTAGMAMAFYGLVRSRSGSLWGGVWLGTGAGLAFMSKGLLGPGIIAVSALLLPAMFASWRGPCLFKALLVASVAASPWVFVWPMALYFRDYELFMLWFWDNNFGRYFGTVGLGPPTQDLFWLRTFPWVTFPLFPLAIWTLWRLRQGVFANEGVRVALAVSLVGWGVLFASQTGRDLYAMPLLAPLAVIAAGAIHLLPRWVVMGCYWISALLFGALAVVLWWLWLHGLIVGAPPQLAILGRYLSLDFAPTWQWTAVLSALLLQLGWVWVLLRFRPPSPSALLAWPAGLMLIWGLAATLHLPWIDHAKSYRSVFVELAQALPPDVNCVADLDDMRLRESERGMLHYVAGLSTEHIQHPEDTRCDIILVEARIRHHGTDVDLGSGWERIWQGSRPADSRDLFILFKRTANSH